MPEAMAPHGDIITGIPETHRAAAARLYDEAFGPKLALAIPDAADRIRLFERGFDLGHAIGAVADGELVGLAGFSTDAGSLTGDIGYRDLLSGLGLLGGHRAALVLALYERKAAPGELLMDGIAVDARYRSTGLGTRLLTALVELAEAGGHATVRLDVIDTNPRARALYERSGFVAVRTERFEFLRGVLGFGASTTMVRDVRGTG